MNKQYSFVVFNLLSGTSKLLWMRHIYIALNGAYLNCYGCYNILSTSFFEFRDLCVRPYFRVHSFSGRYFPAFGLNTDRYGISLCIQFEHGSVRILENADQKNSGYFLRSVEDCIGIKLVT